MVSVTRKILNVALDANDALMRLDSLSDLLTTLVVAHFDQNLSILVEHLKPTQTSFLLCVPENNSAHP